MIKGERERVKEMGGEGRKIIENCHKLQKEHDIGTLSKPTAQYPIPYDTNSLSPSKPSMVSLSGYIAFIGLKQVKSPCSHPNWLSDLQNSPRNQLILVYPDSLLVIRVDLLVSSYYKRNNGHFHDIV